MKITYNWLKDYVNINLPCSEAAHLLTMAGAEVTSIEKKEGDFVMELEITPNRADCLSVVGIARELAAVTGKQLSLPKTYREPQIRQSKEDLPISIEIKDKDLCPRYRGVVIERVRVGESPKWLQERLKNLGLRPANSIVDITNFCLLELGQPMHAFDYDKIKGSKIIVRCAKKGEKIKTIDGVERELTLDTLVIADAERPVAIAGVMGGLETEVSSSTKNILLEVANFDPVSIRTTSRRLGLGSESSYRFERGVDIESIAKAACRAGLLITEIAGGKIGSAADKYEYKAKNAKIDYDIKKANSLLGIEIPKSKTVSIFNSLGFDTVISGGHLKVTPPAFRQDLKNDIDLVEEVSRIYGYENIPTTIPAMVSQTRRKDQIRIVQEKIRETLIAGGLSEIITYSLISKDSLKKLSFDEETVIRVINPLSAEQEIMRPTMLAGILNALSWNLNRKAEELKLFELGNVYFKEGNKFEENLRLVIGFTGVLKNNWKYKRDLTFFDVKGAVEAVLIKLGISNFAFEKKEAPCLISSQSAVVTLDSKKIGQPVTGGTMRQAGAIGKVEREILEKFDIKQDVYIAEICISDIATSINLKKSFLQLPKFPFIKRDISILVDINMQAGKIISCIKEAGSILITDIEIFDEYYGRQVPEGKKSLSVSITYQDKSKTLTDGEVDRLHSAVKQALTERVAAQFR